MRVVSSVFGHSSLQLNDPLINSESELSSFLALRWILHQGAIDGWEILKVPKVGEFNVFSRWLSKSRKFSKEIFLPKSSYFVPISRVFFSPAIIVFYAHKIVLFFNQNFQRELEVGVVCVKMKLKWVRFCNPNHPSLGMLSEWRGKNPPKKIPNKYEYLKPLRCEFHKLKKKASLSRGLSYSSISVFELHDFREKSKTNKENVINEVVECSLSDTSVVSSNLYTVCCTY